MKNKHKGTTLDSFLEEEGLLEEVEALAIKKVLAFQLLKLMKKEHFNKVQMANKMQTSRSSLDRLLDPENTSITLNTLVKAAHVLGKKVKLSIG